MVSGSLPEGVRELGCSLILSLTTSICHWSSHFTCLGQQIAKSLLLNTKWRQCCLSPQWEHWKATVSVLIYAPKDAISYKHLDDSFPIEQKSFLFILVTFSRHVQRRDNPCLFPNFTKEQSWCPSLPQRKVRLHKKNRKTLMNTMYLRQPLHSS